MRNHEQKPRKKGTKTMTSTCETHPLYRGLRKSRTGCAQCERIYEENKGKEKRNKEDSMSPVMGDMTCSVHPLYKGLRKSRTECAQCEKIYAENKREKGKETKQKTPQKSEEGCVSENIPWAVEQERKRTSEENAEITAALKEVKDEAVEKLARHLDALTRLNQHLRKTRVLEVGNGGES